MQNRTRAGGASCPRFLQATSPSILTTPHLTKSETVFGYGGNGTIKWKLRASDGLFSSTNPVCELMILGRRGEAAAAEGSGGNGTWKPYFPSIKGHVQSISKQASTIYHFHLRQLYSLQGFLALEILDVKIGGSVNETTAQITQHVRCHMRISVSIAGRLAFQAPATVEKSVSKKSAEFAFPASCQRTISNWEVELMILPPSNEPGWGQICRCHVLARLQVFFEFSFGNLLGALGPFQGGSGSAPLQHTCGAPYCVSSQPSSIAVFQIGSLMSQALCTGIFHLKLHCLESNASGCGARRRCPRVASGEGGAD